MHNAYDTRSADECIDGDVGMRCVLPACVFVCDYGSVGWGGDPSNGCVAPS